HRQCIRECGGAYRNRHTGNGLRHQRPDQTGFGTILQGLKPGCFTRAERLPDGNAFLATIVLLFQGSSLAASVAEATAAVGPPGAAPAYAQVAAKISGYVDDAGLDQHLAHRNIEATE